MILQSHSLMFFFKLLSSLLKLVFDESWERVADGMSSEIGVMHAEDTTIEMFTSINAWQQNYLNIVDRKKDLLVIAIPREPSIVCTAQLYVNLGNKVDNVITQFFQYSISYFRIHFQIQGCSPGRVLQCGFVIGRFKKQNPPDFVFGRK